jgi:hypothetical protein
VRADYGRASVERARVIHSDARGALVVLTIDRPERRNALDHETLDGLAASLAACGDGVRAVDTWTVERLSLLAGPGLARAMLLAAEVAKTGTRVVPA